DAFDMLLVPRDHPVQQAHLSRMRDACGDRLMIQAGGRGGGGHVAESVTCKRGGGSAGSGASRYSNVTRHGSRRATACINGNARAEGMAQRIASSAASAIRVGSPPVSSVSESRMPALAVGPGV